MSSDKEALRETFDLVDEDDDGAIDRDEFGRLIDALGAEMSEEDIDVGFDLLDENRSGEIDFEEFAVWWDGPEVS